LYVDFFVNTFLWVSNNNSSIEFKMFSDWWMTKSLNVIWRWSAQLRAAANIDPGDVVLRNWTRWVVIINIFLSRWRLKNVRRTSLDCSSPNVCWRGIWRWRIGWLVCLLRRIFRFVSRCWICSFRKFTICRFRWYLKNKCKL